VDDGVEKIRCSRRDVARGAAFAPIALAAAGTTLAAAGAAGTAAAAENAMTFVVAHGAWSSGWAWNKMHPLLTERGHRLYTPSYTGLGERVHLARPEINLDTHITDVVNVLEYEDLRDVVLVGHSYGGIVATGIADRARERLRRLIYLDAFVPENGQSLADLVGGAERLRASAVDGWRVPPNPLPDDTPPEDLEWIAERRMHQPLGTLVQPLTLTRGPLTLARDYILCTKSDTFASYASKARGERWPVHELDSTHSPHLTMPAELADLLVAIAASAA
jgi:pimeloyl-ACP methyl ester carboxylesterase